jgi:hypothetical protein
MAADALSVIPKHNIHHDVADALSVIPKHNIHHDVYTYSFDYQMDICIMQVQGGCPDFLLQQNAK